MGLLGFVATLYFVCLVVGEFFVLVPSPLRATNLSAALNPSYDPGAIFSAFPIFLYSFSFQINVPTVDFNLRLHSVPRMRFVLLAVFALLLALYFFFGIAHPDPPPGLLREHPPRLHLSTPSRVPDRLPRLRGHARRRELLPLSRRQERPSPAHLEVLQDDFSGEPLPHPLSRRPLPRLRAAHPSDCHPHPDHRQHHYCFISPILFYLRLLRHQPSPRGRCRSCSIFVAWAVLLAVSISSVFSLYSSLSRVFA